MDSVTVHQVADLSIGETQVVEVDGCLVAIELRGVEVQRCSLRGAIRSATVQIMIDAEPFELAVGNYTLPCSVSGLRIDCPLIGAYRDDGRLEIDLTGDARLRIWPAGGPLAPGGPWRYPLDQRWFAASTQMSGEPAFISGVESLEGRSYYHFPQDIGGYQDAVPVFACVDGVVVSAGDACLDGHNGPGREQQRYDRLFIESSEPASAGWLIKHSHLSGITLTPGDQVQRGQRVGMLSTTGTSGGWGHLHFEVLVHREDGSYRAEDAYAFLVEAYLTERQPPLLAVARPHLVARTGESVVLDGSRSIAGSQTPAAYNWHFHDGGTASGPQVTRAYEHPGMYSEILEVTGDDGAVSRDFAVICVSGDEWPGYLSLNAAYTPVDGLIAGQEVAFQWCNFPGVGANRVEWDFGDGGALEIHTGELPPSEVEAYPNTVHHRFVEAGEYIVTVRWVEDDRVAMYRLLVVVAETD